MNPEIDTWRIRALAKSVSKVLREEFDTKEFYTAEEVVAACDECRVPDDLVQYAVAMFVEPAQVQTTLEKFGSSRTSLELRKALAAQIFFAYQPDVSYGNLMNDFHAAGDHGGHVSNSLADGCDGGSDGGGDGGGDGGE
jgi:hypothetical protein